jgi:hypothetical protein
MSFRVIASVLLLVFLPLGLYTVNQAYKIEDNPQVFVMFIFSGTLMILLGLTGVIGLCPIKIKTTEPPEEAKDDSPDFDETDFESESSEFLDQSGSEEPLESDRESGHNLNDNFLEEDMNDLNQKEK